MTERHERGLADTCVVIDLPALAPERLPLEIAIPSVVLAELAQGVAMAKDPVETLARAQRLADAEADFDAVPFTREAARCYGTLVALTIRSKRDPRPRGCLCTRGIPTTSRAWSRRWRSSLSDP
jgi:predicted nucleic acid-binding protein